MLTRRYFRKAQRLLQSQEDAAWRKRHPASVPLTLLRAHDRRRPWAILLHSGKGWKILNRSRFSGHESAEIRARLLRTGIKKKLYVCAVGCDSPIVHKVIRGECIRLRFDEVVGIRRR